MKFIKLQCPYCGAQVEANSQLQTFMCNYCGNSFMIDQEIQKVEMKVENAREVGREIEHGRRDVFHSANMELASEVKKLLDFLVRLNNMTLEMEKKRKALSSAESSIVVFFVCAVISFLLASFLLLIGIELVDGTVLVGSLLVLFIGFVLSYMVYWGKKSASRLELEIKKLEKQTIRSKSEVDNIDWSVIPPDYRNEQAMKFIYQALVNQRAMTMQEAVNLYEDVLHKGRIEALQRINAQATLLNAEATMLNNF